MSLPMQATKTSPSARRLSTSRPTGTMRPGKRKTLDLGHPMGAVLDKLEQVKASIRAKVEHPFRVIKQQFGHVKVCYQGMAQLHTLFALSNLWMARHRLMNGSAS